jgi:hypothetical protein
MPVRNNILATASFKIIENCVEREREREREIIFVVTLLKTKCP